MMNFLASRGRNRRLGIVLAMAPALLLLCQSSAGQPGRDVGPRDAVCTRCWLIFTFIGGGDGSFHSPAGMSRNEKCPACGTSGAYEKPPDGTAPGTTANEVRNKYKGVAGGTANHKKRQGDLPAGEFAGGDRQLQEDRDRLQQRWDDLKSAVNVLGTIADPGKPTLGAPVPPIALEMARAALRDECAQQAKAAARLAKDEQDNLLLESMLLALAMPEKKNATSAGLGRLVALRQETATAYRQLAAALEPLNENKIDKGVQARPYYQPVVPFGELLPQDKRLAADRQFWIEACNSRIRANALLTAIAGNSTRHQRADTHHDVRAMAGLATRMIEQITDARAQSLTEAGAYLDFQRARLEMLSQALKENPDWEKRWEALRQQAMASKKVPKEMSEAWTLLGLPGLADEKVLGLAHLTPADIETRLSERRGGLAVVHDVRTLLQKDKLAWPESHDVGLLDRLERFSRRLFPQINANLVYYVSAFDGSWYAVPSGGTVDLRHRGEMHHAAHTKRFLAPGKYDIWVPLEGPGTPGLPPAVRVYTGIEVAAGKPLKALERPKSLPAKKAPTAFGEFQLRVADGIAPPFSWYLFPQDASYTDQAVKGSAKFEPLKVPVGKYDLYWYATEEHAPLVLARGLEIGDRQSVAWDLDYGILLERGKGIPGHLLYGWWGVTLPGEAPLRRLNWTYSGDRLLVPPGEYDVYWMYGYGHLAVRVASSVTVKAKSWTTVRAESGLSVKLSPDFPKIDPAKGMLAAAVSGTSDLVDFRFGDELKVPLVLPAGTFDLIVQFNDKTPSQRLRTGIVVPPGGIVEVVLEAPKQK